MRKTLSVLYFLLVLADSVHAKPKEPMSYTINLTEIAPKITFLNNNKHADQAEVRIDVTKHVRKLIGRLPTVGDTVTVVYEGSFQDYVSMNGRNMYIALIDDSEAAGWYKELSEYDSFSKGVSQYEQISASVTLTVIKNPNTKCVLNIGFHTTPELARKRPKLIATVKAAEEPSPEKNSVENTSTVVSGTESAATKNQNSETLEPPTVEIPARSWKNIMDIGLSFPQTLYTVTGLENEDYDIEDVDTKISTFDAHYAWLPTHKSGLTFKLGMDYGMGFVHPDTDDDDPAFVNTDIELLAGAGFTFGKGRFAFRALAELGFGTLSYKSTRNYYISGGSCKAESDGVAIYFPIGVDVGMHIFFNDYGSVGLYLGSSFHAIPAMKSSSSTTTKTTIGSNTYSSTSVNIYTTGSRFRCTPVIGVAITL